MYTYFLLLIAIIPSFLLLRMIYIKDTVEKEPAYLLLILFIGGIISTFITLLLSHLFKSIIPMLNMDYADLNLIQVAFKVLIGVSLIEEVSKWLFNYFIIWKNKEFNYIYDAIVYSTFVALGFATFENIVYVFDYGFLTAIFRGLLSIPGHACFGVFMGYYLGYSKLESIKGNKHNSIKYRIISLIVPITLHFIYNFCLMSSNLFLYLVFIIYIVILYIIAFKKLNKLSNIKTMLTK